MSPNNQLTGKDEGRRQTNNFQGFIMIKYYQIFQQSAFGNPEMSKISQLFRLAKSQESQKLGKG